MMLKIRHVFRRLKLNNVPVRVTRERRLMSCTLGAAAHTRLGRCPKPPSFHGVWGRWPQEESGAWGATPLGDLPSPADRSSAAAALPLRRVEAGLAKAGAESLF